MTKSVVILMGDNITFNSDMTVNIYNMVRGSAWCEDKYLKGKTNKTIGNDKDFVIVENTLLRYTGNDKNPKVPEGVKKYYSRWFFILRYRHGYFTAKP